MKKINKTAFAIGTSIMAGFGSTAVVASDNPFELKELTSGYLNMTEADSTEPGSMKAKDGSCGEGKCGNKTEKDEGKTMEGKCGDKKMDESKAKEGKCGEGKCGDKK
jgi:uncharacterized low-complexity protein